MDANTNSQPVETVNINTKVTNAFGKSFKSATNVNWAKVDKTSRHHLLSMEKKQKHYSTKKDVWFTHQLWFRKRSVA